MTEKYVIIGGTGFLGKSLSQYLLNLGFAVTIISRTPASDLVDLGARYIIGDATSKDILFKSIEIGSKVILLAHPLPPRTNLLSGSQVQAGINDTYELVMAVNDVCVAQMAALLYVSSGGTVYGNYKRDAYSESDPCLPVCVYGMSKKLAEDIILADIKKKGLIACILRLSNPYGPKQLPKGGQGVLAYWLLALKQGQKPSAWGNGQSYRDYIYIDDFCRAVLAISSASKRFNVPVVNVASGSPTSLKKLVSIFEDVCGCQVVEWQQPDSSLPVSFSSLSVKTLFSEFGWDSEIGIEEGVRRTFEWWFPDGKYR
jgi:UDP-glucose 4-epimerase